MVASKRCLPPRPAELWVNHLDKLRRPKMMARLTTELALQAGHWWVTRRAAERDFDIAREQMSLMLARALDVARDDLREVETDPNATRREKEKAVQKAISLTAMSSFGTVVLPRPGEAVDAVGMGMSNTVLELNRDNKDLYVARLHSHPDFTDEYFGETRGATPKVWYRLGDLFISREPSAPGSNMVEDLQTRNIAVDFASLEMLTPYAAYRPDLL